MDKRKRRLIKKLQEKSKKRLTAAELARKVKHDKIAAHRKKWSDKVHLISDGEWVQDEEEIERMMREIMSQ